MKLNKENVREAAAGLKFFQSQATLEKEDIRELIPHAGQMCLLDRIISWDDRRIHCLSETHLDRDNPLRFEGCLPAIALIEYGAQAAAVHGSLLAIKHSGTIRQGYLAAVRDAQFFVDELDNLTSCLDIIAEINLRSDTGVVYTFTVANKEFGIVSAARATIMHVHLK